MSLRTLTSKQKRFIQEYLVDENATQAAIRAGYSRKTAAQIGYENLRKPYIKEEIAALRADIGNEISPTRVIRNILAIRNEAIAAKNYAVALRCTELIGKHIGMWSNKQHTGPAVTFVIDGFHDGSKVTDLIPEEQID